MWLGLEQNQKKNRLFEKKFLTGVGDSGMGIYLAHNQP